MAAIESARMLGTPEARIPLSVVIIEMALSPKSNSAISSIDSAINLIRKGNTGNVPLHLKNGSPDYKFPHNYRKYWVDQQYLPDKIKDIKFYHPKLNNYENKLNKINKEMRENK